MTTIIIVYVRFILSALVAILYLMFTTVGGIKKDKEFKIAHGIDGIKIQVTETWEQTLNPRPASYDGTYFLNQKVHTRNVFLHAQKIASTLLQKWSEQKASKMHLLDMNRPAPPSWGLHPSWVAGNTRLTAEPMLPEAAGSFGFA